ncbi:MAG: DUF1566 domain-containing protein [Campylobacterales bacterium]|nr:DUF1566 domain-containing protein [Campylobacterales bacterium]
MKKTVTLWMFAAVSLLIAGGNISPKMAEMVEVPASCKADNVYVEEDAGLMWQDQQYTDAEDGAFKNEGSVGKAGKWGHAVNYCRALNYAGYSDWRLPTEDELIHVHEKEGQVFSYFRDNDFWTSTPTVDRKYYVVFPADAHPYAREASQSNYIRCVRCVEKQ